MLGLSDINCQATLQQKEINDQTRLGLKLRWCSTAKHKGLSIPRLGSKSRPEHLAASFPLCHNPGEQGVEHTFSGRKSIPQQVSQNTDKEKEHTGCWREHLAALHNLHNEVRERCRFRDHLRQVPYKQAHEPSC